MPSLSQQLARFVAQLDYDKLPPDVIEKARVCLLNAYGMALGGRDTAFAPVARNTALAMEGEVTRGATLLGDGRRTTIGGACLANAALFHGRCQEDTLGAAHFGTVLIPLLTAMIEVRRYPLSRLIPALVAGYEIGGLLANTYTGITTPAGFRASPLYGTLAAAAAAAKLMGLDENGIAAAIANAASFSGGVLQSFIDGTDEWRYQVGMAGRNGQAAAELARAGSISAPHALEGRKGFITSFARTEADVPALMVSLGRNWSILQVTFKPYPVCAFNQTPVTGALSLREQIAGAPIDSVDIRMNPFETGYAGMDEVGPFQSISGTLMSIPFCVSTTLTRGVPDMRRMTTYDDSEVNSLVNRVNLIADASVPTLSAVLEVRLRDGRRLSHRQNMTAADYAFNRTGIARLIRRIGAEERVPMAAYDLLERFVTHLPEGNIEDVFASFATIEQRLAA